MKEALDKVRKVLPKSEIVTKLSVYIIKDGMIIAGDGRHSASAPIDSDGKNFCVPGKEFERLIDRLPTVDEVILDEGSVTLKSSRMRGTIKTVDPDDVDHKSPGPDWRLVPEDLLESLKTVRPFVSDNAIHTFALSACLGSDSMIATNNVSLIQVECPMLDGAGHLLPIWAIDYLLARDKNDELTHWQLYPDHAAFKFNDDSWMRTQLINQEFPSVAIKLFEQYKEPQWEIPDEWTEAFNAVADLADGAVEIHNNRLVVRQGVSETIHLTPDTPVPTDGYSMYTAEFLANVIKVATHWQPDVWPNPAPFSAQGVRGFIIGRR